MNRGIAGAVLLVLCAQASQATIVYSGGQVLVQGPINDNVVVRDGSTLTIGSNGLVAGLGGGSSGFFNSAILARDGENTINIEGTGLVVAAPGQRAIYSLPGGTTTVRIGDDARVFGNIDSDTSQDGWRLEETANKRLYIEDRAIVSGNVSSTGFIRLDDQAAILGNLGTSNGESTTHIHGGVVTGQWTPGGFLNHNIYMDGGAILGGVNPYLSMIDMTMAGGYIGGSGITTYGSLDADIHDGQIQGGINVVTSGFGSSFLQSHVSLFGGQLDATAGDWLIDMSFNPSSPTANTSLLEIWGGHLGYANAGLGIRLDYFTNFDIYGRDLFLENGLLSGWLSDGSWFNSALTFGDNWQGVFTIHNVPEPGTYGLLLLSLSGVFLAKRRRVVGVASHS